MHIKESFTRNESVTFEWQLDTIIAYLLEHTGLHEEFRYADLTAEEQDTLYNKFRDAYEKATGAAWDREFFMRRASNWTFFGTIEGGIAVRRQRSGMYKLNATFGSPKQIVSAFHELMNEIGTQPIWGAMTDNLASMLEKLSNKEFRKAPKLFTKTVVPHIKHIFGDEVLGVDDKGLIEVETPAGVMRKAFVANRVYYSHMLDMAKQNPDSLPIPNFLIQTLIPILKSLI